MMRGMRSSGGATAEVGISRGMLRTWSAWAQRHRQTDTVRRQHSDTQQSDTEIVTGTKVVQVSGGQLPGSFALKPYQ